MQHRTPLWVGLAAALVVGVACSAAGPDAEAPSSEGVAPPQPVEEATPAQPQTEATQAPAGEAAQPAPVESVPGRPDEPAPVEADFRSDPASVVAATGHPQLLEFFTYW